jgi:hypothetical protein
MYALEPADEILLTSRKNVRERVREMGLAASFKKE